MNLLPQGEWTLWIVDTRASLDGHPPEPVNAQAAGRLTSWAIDLLLEEVYTEEPIALAINGSATTTGGTNPVPVLPIIGCNSIGYFSSPDTVIAFCSDSPAAVLQPSGTSFPPPPLLLSYSSRRSRVTLRLNSIDQ